MPKYLVQVSYSPDGIKELQKESASGRRELITKVVAELGGKCEAMYWAFGAHDAVAIYDLPSSVEAAALSFAVATTGAVRSTTTPLLTAAETDAALKKSAGLHPPGR